MASRQKIWLWCHWVYFYSYYCIIVAANYIPAVRFDTNYCREMNTNGGGGGLFETQDWQKKTYKNTCEKGLWDISYLL